MPALAVEELSLGRNSEAHKVGKGRWFETVIAVIAVIIETPLTPIHLF